MNHKRQRGFTLIEIMLAVAIISIIAAIATSAYRGYIAESRISTGIKDIRQIELTLNDLAMESRLDEFDGDSGNVRGVYLENGQLTLGDTGTPPSTDAEPWLDPWGRIYRYQRTAGAAGSGVITDGGGNVSNDPTNSLMPQSYDLFSQGVSASDTTDDLVRGCNGEFIGLQSDHPTWSGTPLRCQ